MNRRKSSIKLIILTLVAFTFIVTSIKYFNTKPNAYEVCLNGKKVAYVKNKEDFNNINKQIKSSIEKRFNVKLKNNIDFNDIKASKDIYTSKKIIKDSIVNNNNIKVKGIELKIKNEKVGTLANEKEVLALKNKLKNNKNLAEIEKKLDSKEVSTYIKNVDGMKEVFNNIEKSKTTKTIVKEKRLSRGGFTTKFLRPSVGVISSGFGRRWGRMHNGIDIASPKGTPIYAAENGKVIYSAWEKGYGKVIKIQHKNSVETIYGHCSKLIKTKGQNVKRGEKIAEIGSTGRSTGPHVHFEVRKNNKPVNPLIYLK